MESIAKARAKVEGIAVMGAERRSKARQGGKERRGSARNASKEGRVRPLAGVAAHSAAGNRLLGSLPHEDFERVKAKVELVALPTGMQLAEPFHEAAFAYFPTNAAVSLTRDSADGAQAEVALVGSDGMVGLGACMGAESALERAKVCTSGVGFRMRRASLAEEFESCKAMRRAVLGHAQGLMAQMAQAAFCAKSHPVGAQLCRRLLEGVDRAGSPELALTHEAMAGMLGVRRESVTEALGKLSREGVVACRRGRVILLDRAAMESRACSCYRCLAEESKRIAAGKGKS